MDNDKEQPLIHELMNRSLHALCLSVFVVFSVLISCTSANNYQEFRSEDRSAILKTLADQQDAWNQGDVEKFMEGYWKSDSLQFIGSDGLNFGWLQTLDHYKEVYPDTIAMGKLSFDILRINPVSSNAAYLTGTFFLKRQIGDLKGIFTIVLRKFDNQWLIVYDHTSD